MRNDSMRRLVYMSRATSADTAEDQQAIFGSARRNNGLDGITGVLWAEDGRYLQLLEGPDESVTAAFRRISSDDRHTDIVVLEDREVTERAFSEWAMAGLPGERPADTRERLRLILRRAPTDVLRYFPDVKGG